MMTPILANDSFDTTNPADTLMSPTMRIMKELFLGFEAPKVSCMRKDWHTVREGTNCSNGCAGYVEYGDQNPSRSCRYSVDVIVLFPTVLDDLGFNSCNSELHWSWIRQQSRVFVGNKKLIASLAMLLLD